MANLGSDDRKILIIKNVLDWEGSKMQDKPKFERKMTYHFLFQEAILIYNIFSNGNYVYSFTLKNSVHARSYPQKEM